MFLFQSKVRITEGGKVSTCSIFRQISQGLPSTAIAGRHACDLEKSFIKPSRKTFWESVLCFERQCIEISSCPSLILRDCLDVCSDLENTDCTRKNDRYALRIGRVISPQVPWHVLSLADQNRQAPQAQSTHAHHQTISDDFYLAEELILLFVTPTMPEE